MEEQYLCLSCCGLANVHDNYVCGQLQYTYRANSPHSKGMYSSLRHGSAAFQSFSDEEISLEANFSWQIIPCDHYRTPSSYVFLDERLINDTSRLPQHPHRHRQHRQRRPRLHQNLIRLMSREHSRIHAILYRAPNRLPRQLRVAQLPIHLVDIDGWRVICRGTFRCRFFAIGDAASNNG